MHAESREFDPSNLHDDDVSTLERGHDVESFAESCVYFTWSGPMVRFVGFKILHGPTPVAFWQKTCVTQVFIKRREAVTLHLPVAFYIPVSIFLK